MFVPLYQCTSWSLCEDSNFHIYRLSTCKTHSFHVYDIRPPKILVLTTYCQGSLSALFQSNASSCTLCAVCSMHVRTLVCLSGLRVTATGFLHPAILQRSNFICVSMIVWADGPVTRLAFMTAFPRMKFHFPSRPHAICMLSLSLSLYPCNPYGTRTVKCSTCRVAFMT